MLKYHVVFQALACFLLITHSSAEIFEWRDETLNTNGLKIRSSIELWTIEDAPSLPWPFNDRHQPQVDINLTFETRSASTTDSFIIQKPITEATDAANIEIAVFHAPHGGDDFTYTYERDGQTERTTCCSAEMVANKQGQCTAENQLYLSENVDDLRRWTINMASGKNSLIDTVLFNVTGEHFLIIADCSPIESVDNKIVAFFPNGIAVSGRTVWMNTFGHLIGRMFGYLPFYLAMTEVYAVVSFIWLVLCLIHRSQLVSVHHCISAVLALCLLECIVSFAEYVTWNNVGIRPNSISILAIIISVMRLTVSRMLVVAVSLGWGVVRPSLGKNRWKLIVLGIVYFTCEVALEFVQRSQSLANSHSDNDSAEDPVARAKAFDRWRVALIVPVSLLNSILYWWTLLSLHRMLIFLSMRKQTAKFAIYRSFTVVLVISLAMAVCYAGYQIYISVTLTAASHWETLWLIDEGAPFIIYTTILVAIATLWRPSSNSKAYQYSQLQTNGEFDQSMQPDSMGFDDEMDANGNDMIEMAEQDSVHERGELHGGSSDEEEEDIESDDEDDTRLTIDDDDSKQTTGQSRLKAQFLVDDDDES